MASWRITHPIQNTRPVATVRVARRVAAELDTIWRSGNLGVIVAMLVKVRQGGECRTPVIGFFPTHQRGNKLLKLIDAVMNTVWGFRFLRCGRVPNVCA